MNSIQYTVRNIPEDVDKILRLRTKKNKQNFNKTLVDALSKSANIGTQKNDLEWLYGSGGIGKEEQESFESQRTIDKKAWK